MPSTVPTLLQAIMAVGSCYEAEAEVIQQELVQAVIDGEDPETVLHDFGLEPDYVLDLLNLL